MCMSSNIYIYNCLEELLELLRVFLIYDHMCKRMPGFEKTS